MTKSFDDITPVSYTHLDVYKRQMLYDGAEILSQDNFIYGGGGRLTF